MAINMATALSIASAPRAGGARRSFAPAALWGAQGLLAVLFLFAGSMKFIMSGEDMTKDTDLSLGFLRFIGACEVLGAFGLILPGVFNIRRLLTPLAAIGLVIIMVGATSITAATMGIAPALFPAVVGLVAGYVAYARRSWFALK